MSDLRFGPPSPEEFQKHITEFMRQHFPNVASPFAAKPETDSTPKSPAEKKAINKKRRMNFMVKVLEMARGFTAN